MTRRKQFKKVIGCLFLALFFILGVMTIWFYLTYGRDILSLKEQAIIIARNSSAESFKESQTSLVYTDDGSILSVLKSEKEVYYLPFDSIPREAIEAVLVTEDKKFFSHEGIDYLANIRAMIALIKNKGVIRQGGSTITQQLARTVFLTNEVSYERKVMELFLASNLEKKFSKKQILEFYMNNIYYANGYYGIQAASKGYFSKAASELSLSEIAFLSAIPNSPTMLDPLVYIDNTLERRDKILVQMYNDGAITLSDFQKAMDEKIILKHSRNIKYNYAESYTYYCAIRMLMEAEDFTFEVSFDSEDDKKEYEERYYEAYYRIQRQLYKKGYRIYTSLNLEKQWLLQQAVNENLSEFSKVNDEGIYEMQGAAVSIDNNTGRVVAIIGGRQQKTVGYTLNRAYQSFRQPGSAIKPLLIYTPMFEREYDPETLVMDEKSKEGPRNANNVYSGELTLRKAVEVSKNTVAWNLLKELSPSVGLSYLKKMNFSRIVNEDYNLGISLGGFTYGASTLEMTAGFASLAYDGLYRTPTCVIKITDAQGNEIVGDKTQSKRVYDANAARMMTDVLVSVMENGTGKKLTLDNITTAGKTGTTTDRKDGWFVGYSKYYTTGVWVGCDYPKAIDNLAGNTYPGEIWKQFMSSIHKNLVNVAFEPYISMKPVEDTKNSQDNSNLDEEQLNTGETGFEENAMEQHEKDNLGNGDSLKDQTNSNENDFEIDNNDTIDEGYLSEELISEEVLSENNEFDAEEDYEDLAEDIGEKDMNSDGEENGDVSEDFTDEGWDEQQWIEEQWPNL